MDLTYNNTAFWAAYINYETQYAQQLHIKLIGPLLAAANASLQNTQIENLVNEGAKAIIVNPETATSLGPAISYAAAHHVQLVSVDTIVGVGKVYMVVRASNTNYGLDACALISSKVKSGYVLDLEGDLTSSNGADRTNAFNQCMAANDPGVHILKDPTVWTEATAVTDAQNAVNAYGSQLKAIYSQWSSPDTGILPLLKSKGMTGKVLVVSDDGVPFEMCDVGNGTLSASQSQPANLYAVLGAEVRARRGERGQAERGPARRRRAHVADGQLRRGHQPRRPDRGAVRDQGLADADRQPGRRPARHGDHHPRRQFPALGQRLRQRTRRRLQLIGRLTR